MKGKAKRKTEGGKAEGAKSRAGWRGVGGGVVVIMRA